MRKEEINAYCPFENKRVTLLPGEGGYRRCPPALLCESHSSERRESKNSGDLLMPPTRVATGFRDLYSEKVRACACDSSVVGKRWMFAGLKETTS